MSRATYPMLIALSFAVAGAVLLRALSPPQAPVLAPQVAVQAPDSRFLTRFTVTDAPDRFEQVLMVVDFPPRTWTPVHAPGGNVYNTVIDGQISVRQAGVPNSEMTYPAGDAFVETSGEWMQIGNSTDTNARVIATALLPGGARFTIDQRGVSSDQYPDFGAAYRAVDTVARPGGPILVYRSSSTVDRPASTLDLAQWLVELEPGIWTPVTYTVIRSSHAR
jgi:quercetin dioxygenase-like cupin family protein